MFKKLRNNFVLLNMIIISSMMLIVFAIVYISMYQNTVQNLRNRVSVIPTSQRLIIRDIEENETFPNGVLPSDYTLSFSLSLSRDGSLLRVNSYIDMSEESYYKAAEEAFKNNKEYGTLKLDNRTWIYRIRSNNFTMVRNLPPEIVDNRDAYTIVFLDITDSMSSLNRLLFTFVVVGIFMLGVIYVISVYFARRSVKEIEEAWNKQKQFVADASHEFKTPIAVIEANADALLLEEKQNNKKWIDYIKAETGRMTRLVTDLLYLAKTENMDMEFDDVPFDISEVLKKVVLSMEAIIYEKDLTLIQDIEDNLFFKGDTARIEQVMIILIDNAIKYSGASGEINISLKRNNKLVELSIENTGDGISEEDISKIFDRFYRSDKARTGTDNSYGLGLSIAKATIERMGGKIIAHSIQGEKTKFTVILKIK